LQVTYRRSIIRICAFGIIVVFFLKDIPVRVIILKVPMGMHTFLAFCAEDDIQASVVEALYVLAVYEVINNYLLVVRRCEPTILEIHPARNSNVLGTSQ